MKKKIVGIVILVILILCIIGIKFFKDRQTVVDDGVIDDSNLKKSKAR